MINPKIREEYGVDGVRILADFCKTISNEERDSIYAVGHNHLSKVKGVMLELASDRDDLVDTLCSKIMNHIFGIDSNTIVLCEKYDGEGIKVWLTSQ